MGFNFRKTIRIGKWLRLNLSKNGIGVSFGNKYARVNRSAKGKTSATISLPGTGLSYTHDLDGKEKKEK